VFAINIKNAILSRVFYISFWSYGSQWRVLYGTIK